MNRACSYLNFALGCALGLARKSRKWDFLVINNIGLKSAKNQKLMDDRFLDFFGFL